MAGCSSLPEGLGGRSGGHRDMLTLSTGPGSPGRGNVPLGEGGIQCSPPTQTPSAQAASVQDGLSQQPRSAAYRELIECQAPCQPSTLNQSSRLTLTKAPQAPLRKLRLRRQHGSQQVAESRFRRAACVLRLHHGPPFLFFLHCHGHIVKAVSL